MKSQKELLEELNVKRKEISELKEGLNKLNDEKEEWFRKKEELFSKIKAGINQIKDFKVKRDSLTNEVKALKPKRDSLNQKHFFARIGMWPSTKINASFSDSRIISSGRIKGFNWSL